MAHVAEVKTHICSKCGLEHPATPAFFTKAKTCSDGISFTCRECNRRESRGYYATHREQHAESVARNRQENPAVYRTATKNWRERNPERNRQVWDDYYATHKEYESQRSKARIHARRGHPGVFTKADVQVALLMQECRCFYCDMPLSGYHVDHYIPLAKGGTNWALNLVIACPSCNRRKKDKLPSEFV